MGELGPKRWSKAVRITVFQIAKHWQTLPLMLSKTKSLCPSCPCPSFFSFPCFLCFFRAADFNSTSAFSTFVTSPTPPPRLHLRLLHRRKFSNTATSASPSASTTFVTSPTPLLLLHLHHDQNHPHHGGPGRPLCLL